MDARLAAQQRGETEQGEPIPGEQRERRGRETRIRLALPPIDGDPECQGPDTQEEAGPQGAAHANRAGSAQQP